MGTRRKQVDLIVNAITEGFDKVDQQFDRAGKASKKLGEDVKKSNTRFVELKSKVDLAGQSLQKLGEAARKVYETIQRGAQVEAATATFDNLSKSIGVTSDVMLGDMQLATRNMVSEMDLMQASNKFMAMGLASTSKEAAKLAEMSTQLGIAMGKGPNEAMEEMALLLANQSIPRLDTFGISAGKVRERIKELTAGINGLDRESAFMQATMEQAEVTMGKVGEQSLTTAGKLGKLEAEFADVKDAASVTVSRGFEPVIDSLLEISAATDESDKSSTKWLLAINQLNVALGGIGVSTKAIKNLTNDYADIQGDAARAAADHTNFTITQNEAVQRLSRSLEDSAKAIKANRDHYQEMVKAGEIRRSALEAEIALTDDVTDSAIRAEQAFNEMADAETKRAGTLASLTKETKAQTEALGGYFIAAIDATDETSLYGVALDKLGTTYSTVGGLTNQQREDLNKLQTAYDKAEDIIHDYDIGLKGAGLSTDEIAEKTQEQREEMDRLAGAMEPLIGITGDLVSTTQDATFDTAALTDELFEQAQAADADALSLAVLATATGDYTDEEIKAALQAAVMKEQIALLAESVAAGTMSAQEALVALDDLQTKMAEDFNTVIHVDTTDAHDKVRRLTLLLDGLDGRHVRSTASVDTVSGPAGKGHEKGGTPTQIPTGAGVPEFATGGSFIVGGSGSTDSQLVQFKATPGERVTVTPQNHFTQNIFTSANTEPIERDFNMMQARMGA